MSYSKGLSDSTRCLVTVSVDNKDLHFFRGERSFIASYSVYMMLRHTEKNYLIRTNWKKELHVPNYDQTSLAERNDPMYNYLLMAPGKWEGFVEIKDNNAVSYGDGPVSVVVPDFSRDLPRLGTPVFFDPDSSGPDSLPVKPALEDELIPANLNYPSGKPIFLVVDVYADSTKLPRGWTIVAEVVKPLMVFPQVTVPVEDGLTAQRILLEIPTKTMGLGSYEVELELKDSANSQLARATSFSFRIIKSAEWVETNYSNEVKYLKYIATEKELKELGAVPEGERAQAIKNYWETIDPVPATAINEIKVQYFERIDYANRHFTSEDKEGWETNMGEVYILLGPPVEIYGSRLNQIWVYERENLVLYFFNHNLRNRDEFDRYIRDHRKMSY
jgi:GWxTD domain-containing protein